MTFHRANDVLERMTPTSSIAQPESKFARTCTNMKNTISTTRNWHTVVFSILLGMPFIALFRKHGPVRFEHGEVDAYFLLRDLISGRYRGRAIEIQLLKESGRYVVEIEGAKFFLTKELGRLGAESIMRSLEMVSENLSGYEAIDVGAYVGDAAIVLALRGATVHAYEPVPHVYSMMVENIALNGLERMVFPVNCAVGSSGSLTLATNRPEGYVGSSSFDVGAGTSVTMQSLTLGEALAKCQRGTKKILKLDCEGCEALIVTTNNLALLNSFDQIICECHPDLTGITPQALKEVLESAGFDVSLIGLAPRETLVANRVTQARLR